jgi:GNAT superfamily N-acetyltransferase
MMTPPVPLPAPLPAASPPAVIVQPLDGAAGGMLTQLIAPRIAATPYSAVVRHDDLRRAIFGDQPTFFYPVRLQQQRALGAWHAGQLVGFLDAVVGLDADSQEVPDYHPLGLIRFMALPDRSELTGVVAEALLGAAQNFWQESGVAYVKAFHISTGYPFFQAGAGILPGDWGDVVRVLTGAGFLLRARYYCFVRRLVELVEEVVPLADLSLVFRGDWHDRRYEIYYRRVEMVARAHVVRMHVAGDEGALPIAKIIDLFVEPDWRHKDIGKWLLRRILNDATHQGDAQAVVHLAQHRHVALNLLIQQGFQEMNYRGYTLEKALTQ